MVEEPTLDRAMAAESALLAALGVWAGVADGGGIERGDGWTLAWASAPVRSFNNLITTDERAPVAALVARARERAPHGRFRLRVREDVAVDDGVFERSGLRRYGGIPCLTIEPNGPLPVPAGARVDRVGDEAALRAHVEVVAAGFGWVADDIASACRPAILRAPRWRGFVVRDGSRGASAAQLVFGDGGAAGIYFVATREEARGRGFGAAVTAAAVNAALAEGATTVSLQASPMGLPIYERLGFARVSYYRTFVPAG